MLKKAKTLVIGALVVASVTTFGALAEVNAHAYSIPQWSKESDGWHYKLGGEVRHEAYGWQKIGSYWYFFASNGVMLTGWVDMCGDWYYLYEGGNMASNSWIGNFYVGNNGAWVPNA